MLFFKILKPFVARAVNSIFHHIGLFDSRDLSLKSRGGDQCPVSVTTTTVGINLLLI